MLAFEDACLVLRFTVVAAVVPTETKEIDKDSCLRHRMERMRKMYFSCLQRYAAIRLYMTGAWMICLRRRNPGMEKRAGEYDKQPQTLSSD